MRQNNYIALSLVGEWVNEVFRQTVPLDQLYHKRTKYARKSPVLYYFRLYRDEESCMAEAIQRKKKRMWAGTKNHWGSADGHVNVVDTFLAFGGVTISVLLWRLPKYHDIRNRECLFSQFISESS